MVHKPRSVGTTERGAAFTVVRQIQAWRTARVKPYPANARRHTDEDVARLAEFIKRHGFNKPLEVNRAGVLLAGHRRLAAAQRLGMQWVPVVVHAHLTEEHEREYRIADNRLTLDGEWDGEVLAAEIAAIEDAGGSEAFTGFAEGEVERMLAALERDAGPDVPEAGAPREEFAVVVDCRDAAHVERVIAELRAKGYSCRAARA